VSTGVVATAAKAKAAASTPSLQKFIYRQSIEAFTMTSRQTVERQATEGEHQGWDPDTQTKAFCIALAAET